MTTKFPTPEMMARIEAVAADLIKPPSPNNFDLASLKSLLGHFGVKQRGWKLLIDYWDEILGTLRSINLTNPRRPLASLENICILLRLLQECEIDAAPPRELIRGWVKLTSDDEQGCQLTDVPSGLFRASWKEYMRIQSYPKELANFIDKVLPQVFDWYFLTSQDQAMSDGDLRRGWSYLFNEYVEWDMRRTHNYDKQKSDWPAVIKPIIITGILVVELASDSQVRQEGVIMRHCVANVIEGCKEGVYHVFSLRYPHTDERVATLGIHLVDGLWSIDDLKMQDNEDPFPELQQVADEVLEMLCEQKRDEWAKREGMHAWRLRQLFAVADAEGGDDFCQATAWVFDHLSGDIYDLKLADLQAAYIGILDHESSAVAAKKAYASQFESMSDLIYHMPRYSPQSSLFEESWQIVEVQKPAWG